jgi:hypothetical protein
VSHFGIIMMLASWPAQADEACDPADSDACHDGQACISDAAGKECPALGRCVDLPSVDTWPEIPLPVAAGTSMHCAKGPLKSGADSHGFCRQSTRFAVDLATLTSEAPALLLAPHDGIAWGFTGCGSGGINDLEDRLCNLGWGNFVRIATPDGRYTQLAHLSEVHVGWGQDVVAGQVLGVEGNSGNASGRHLHLSVHEGNPRQLGAGASIPFQLTTTDSSIRIDHLPCDDHTESQVATPGSRHTSSLVAISTTGSYGAGAHDGMDPLAAMAMSPLEEERTRAIDRLRDADSDQERYWYGVALVGSTSAADLRAAARVFRELRHAEVAWVRDWSALRTCGVLRAQGRAARADACATQLATDMTLTADQRSFLGL